jgi:PKD repeat protein
MLLQHMNKVSVFLVLTLAVAGAVYGQDCPVEKPHEIGAFVRTGCQNSPSCMHGTPIGLTILPLPTGFFPPETYHPGYQIQACDQVTWSFGDGSSETKSGVATATHTWATPGNYRITATVTNTLGSATYETHAIVGPRVQIEWISETVSETAGSVSLAVLRTGDTSRRVSARLLTTRDPYNAGPAVGDGSYPVVFEPGETIKKLVIPLADNKLFDGTRQEMVRLTDAAGGTLLKDGMLRVTDDEPRPTIYAESLAVGEGNSGLKRVTVNVYLTGPLGSYINLYGALQAGTAQFPSDFLYYSQGSQIRSGETSGTFWFDIIADKVPELDEELTLRIGPYGGGFPWSPIDGPPARITILNDDSDLAPHVHRGYIGERVLMTLSPGEVFDEPVIAQIRTNNPTALGVPQTITIPAGSLSVHFRVDLIGEGEGGVTVKVGAREFGSQFTSVQRRALVASQTSLSLLPRGAGTFALSLSPPHDKPVTVLLTTNPGVLSVPASVVIPPGGEAVVEVEAVGRGPATIAANALEPDVADVAIAVDVSMTRRRAIR